MASYQQNFAESSTTQRDEENMKLYCDYIYISKYARWLYNKNRRETWEETVSRYCNYAKDTLLRDRNYQLTDYEYKMLYDAIYAQDVMPSMRALATAGPALENDNCAGYNCAYAIINRKEIFAEVLYILMNGTGMGYSVERQYINQLPTIPESLIKSDYITIVEDSKYGWMKSYNDLIINLYDGKIIKWDVSKVRPKGAPLKTFGGRASGPEYLVNLFNFTIKTFENAKGRKLESIECHDLLCKIAETVISGGTRRSACLSLSNLSDLRMRNAKSGEWWNIAPYRAFANNSIAYTEKPSMEIFIDEWVSLYKSKSGERGIFNRKAAQDVVKRIGRRDPNHEFGCNPCVPKDTWIATNKGYFQVADLINRNDYKIIVDGRAHDLGSNGFFKTGTKQLFEITLINGIKLRATEDHPIKTKNGFVKVKNLKPGQTICMSNHETFRNWVGYGKTYLDGMNFKINNCIWSGEMAPEAQSSEFYRGFIENMLNTYSRWDNLKKCIRMHFNMYHPILPMLQRMLMRFGILSEYYDNNTDALHLRNTLYIYHPHITKLLSFINYRHEIQEPEEKIENDYKHELPILSINISAMEDVYDVTVAMVHEFCANGIQVHNCVSKDTWIATDKGHFQVKNLIEKTNYNIISNGKSYNLESNGFFKTGIKQLFEIELQNGLKLKATDYHPIVTPNGEIKVKDLKIGDKVCLSNHSDFTDWNGNGGTFEEGWLLGELLGDGCIDFCKTKSNHIPLGILRFWHNDQTSKYMLERALNFSDKCGLKTRSDCNGSENQQNKYYQYQSVGLYQLYLKYGGNSNIKKENNEIIETLSSEFYKGFIQGLFDSDGTCYGNPAYNGFSIRLSQIDLPRLEMVQRMLLRFGIVSIIYKERSKAKNKLLPANNGTGDYKEYFCQAMHELCIGNHKNLSKFADLINFGDPKKKNKLNTILKSYSSPYKINYTSKIININPVEIIDVYDVTVSEVHRFCANGLSVVNCSEIILRDCEFCNLTEVIIRPTDKKEDLLRKVKIATILGTVQASWTKFNHISDKWKANCDEEALLGVSLTGIMDNPLTSRITGELRDLLTDMRFEAIKTNSEWAKKIGIRQAAAITAIKPSGSVSQLTNTASGIHTRYAKYYIRTVRGNLNDPLTKFMQDQGIPNEPDLMGTNSMVFSFPIKSPETSRFRDEMSAIEQLEIWLLYQTYWTEHKPSVTIMVKEHEWLQVAAWVYDHFDKISGVSFLPYDTGMYQQAPYQEVNQETYETALAKMPKSIDWNELAKFEKESNVVQQREYACTGDTCVYA